MAIASFGPFHVNWLHYYPELWRGVLRTVAYTLGSFAGAVALGLILALMRRSRSRIARTVSTIYIEALRNTPLLTEIFVVYFGLGSIGLKLSVFASGTISLLAFYAAYLAEIFRGALAAVPPGQMEAGQALGLSEMATLRKIVLPQAARVALPGTATMFVDCLKSTSLLVTIAAAELMTVGQLIAAATFRAMEVYLVIGAIYFLLAFPLSRLLMVLERKIERGDPITPGRRQLRRMVVAGAGLGPAGSGIG